MSQSMIVETHAAQIVALMSRFSELGSGVRHTRVPSGADAVSVELSATPHSRLIAVVFGGKIGVALHVEKKITFAFKTDDTPEGLAATITAAGQMVGHWLLVQAMSNTPA